MGQGQVQNLANDVKKLFDLWNLRFCLIVSLFLQAFLMFVASLRKRRKSNFLHMWIWSAYLLADWIAAYALGQTVQSPGGDLYDPNKSGELYLFWAQFLLLHLAGPDSITSFSLGDNGVWLKSLFSLLCQVVATIYSFSLLTLAKKNKLWIPTMLVFVVGLIKCYERVKALLISSFDRFGDTLLPEPDPGLDYEEAASKKYGTMWVGQNEMQPVRKTMPTYYENNDHTKTGISMYEIKLMRHADSFFKDFKLLFSGSFLSFENREASCKYFKKCDYSTAFRLIEYELSFLHDLMHTKVAVLQNTLGYIRRFICFSFILVASVLFFRVEKLGYSEFDVDLTHALLMGTIFLDLISLTKLIFSERSLIRLPTWIRNFIPLFLLKRKHWSRSVFQYNMFSYCLYKRPTRLLYSLAGYMFGSTVFVDKIRLWFSSSERVPKDLEKLIFMELKRKSEETNSIQDAIKACKDRGLSALWLDNDHATVFVQLEWSITEFDYLASLLLWHLATELCSHNLESSLSAEIENQIKFCKILSNYMFYLLVFQPTMLSQEVGNWSTVFQDTQAEAKRFFRKYSISHHMEARAKLNSVRTKYRPASVKGSKSKSLLFDACILAKQLLNMKQPWKVMYRVWIELMSFAAMNCSPTIHALQPSRGGELLTFTWLLMYHLGLGTQISEEIQAPNFENFVSVN